MLFQAWLSVHAFLSAIVILLSTKSAVSMDLGNAPFLGLRHGLELLVTMVARLGSTTTAIRERQLL